MEVHREVPAWKPAENCWRLTARESMEVHRKVPAWKPTEVSREPAASRTGKTVTDSWLPTILKPVP